MKELYLQRLSVKQYETLGKAKLADAASSDLCTCLKNKKEFRYEHYWLVLVQRAINEVGCWTDPSRLLDEEHKAAAKNDDCRSRPDCAHCFERIDDSIALVAARWNGKDGKSAVEL